MARGAVEPRSAGYCGSAGAHNARARFRAALRSEDLDPGDARRIVRCARGYRGAWRSGVAGRDARGHRHLRHGFLCCEQADARVGDSRGAWRRATADPASLAGQGLSPAGHRLRRRHYSGTAGDSCAVVHCLSGNTERSHSAGRRNGDDVAARHDCCVDSGAPCTCC